MHEPAHLLAEADVHVAEFMQVGDVLRPPLGEDRGEDVFLVVKVVIDEAVRDACVLGDVGDLRAMKACAREHLGGGGDDALTSLRTPRGPGSVTRGLSRVAPLAQRTTPSARIDAISSLR